ncbi:Uncharacterized protein TCM_016672 [Theobroma cacao]|uniref:Uncharacterized protein n=1 Tax=Theobroma cacao TaxID=3641 RepID=A0A061G832_THECC|nr:Uncharacterized protein TCM_016672 [Theobroma cacao]
MIMCHEKSIANSKRLGMAYKPLRQIKLPFQIKKSVKGQNNDKAFEEGQGCCCWLLFQLVSFSFVLLTIFMASC